MPSLPDWNDLPQAIRTGLVREAETYCEEGSEGEAAVALYRFLRENLDEARRVERQERAYADLFEEPTCDPTPPGDEDVDPVSGRASVGPFTVVYDGDALVSIGEADPSGEERPGDVGPEVVVALAREVSRLHRLLGRPGFQPRVSKWMLACFGETISDDLHERNHRFLEEALELVQSCGCTRSEAYMLVDYVFDRPVGNAPAEVGGVCVTLAALCRARRIDMHAEGERELRRIWGMIDRLRAKQASRPKSTPLAMAMHVPDVVAPFVAAAQALPYDAGGTVLWNPGPDAPAITLRHVRDLVGRYTGGRIAA